jgi:hypothetical protein
MSSPALVEELTPAWLSDVLGGRVDAVRAEPVGTGQIGTCHRLHLDGEGVPGTVLAKLPAVDPAARELLAGVYRTEAIFYAEVAPTVAIRVPACHHATMPTDSGDFVLLLEDLAPAVQGDQLVGCTADQARDAAVNLAGLHGPRWCDPSLLDLDGVTLTDAEGARVLGELYGPATDIFLDGLGGLLAAEDHDTLRACVAVTEGWALARSERFGLVHGDYRLDNLLFPPGGGPGSVAVDWQTLSLGLPARDLAYLLGTGLPVADRRAHERDLVAAYHSALAGHGVAAYSAEQAWDDYRFAMLQGPLVSVFGCAYGTRTDRGDRMFAAMVTRSCAAIRDLGSLEMATG